MEVQKEDFSKRLTELRLAKGVSARDMSLSIGQSVNYINSIENNKSLPSMESFFNICEYLNISPAQFFNKDINSPNDVNELMRLVDHLNSKQLEAIINIIKL